MNFLHGPKLRVTLAELRAASRDAVGHMPASGLWVFPTYEASLKHKLQVLYAYYQRWDDVRRLLGIKIETLHSVRKGRTNLGKAALARLDSEYQLTMNQINLNIAQRKRLDEGAPCLQRWREKRKYRNVGYHLTRKAKRRSRQIRQPAQDQPGPEPSVSDSAS